MQASRRTLLFGLAAAAATGVAPSFARDKSAPSPLNGGALTAQPLPPPRAIPQPAPATDIRRLALHNLHTGDTLSAVYYERGAYVPDALAEARRVLRDWRNGEQHEIDPRVFDAMHGVAERLETRAPFQIISGYRSPATNAMLHERSNGVATRSQHTLGKAVDVRIEGIELTRLHKAALDLRAGGVGYYPTSGFVHMDTARVRTWQGA